MKRCFQQHSGLRGIRSKDGDSGFGSKLKGKSGKGENSTPKENSIKENSVIENSVKPEESPIPKQANDGLSDSAPRSLAQYFMYTCVVSNM